MVKTESEFLNKFAEKVINEQDSTLDQIFDELYVQEFPTFEIRNYIFDLWYPNYRNEFCIGYTRDKMELWHILKYKSYNKYIDIMNLL